MGRALCRIEHTTRNRDQSVIAPLLVLRAASAVWLMQADNIVVRMGAFGRLKPFRAAGLKVGAVANG